MPKNIILTTTPSFSNAVSRSDLGDFLKKYNIEVVLQEQLTPPFSFDAASVFGIVAGAAVKVDKKALEMFPNLSVVTPFGVGIDHINEGALKELDISLRVHSGINKNSVAELTVAFIFALARQLVLSTNDMREGKWDRLIGNEITGKTLGIIGLGNIGKEVAKKAHALGMNVMANDIVYDESFLRSHNIEKADFERVLKKSDFLSLHVPLTDHTQNLVNKKTLAHMKQGAYLINTSRGEVIDEKALVEALGSGTIRGAAFDVFSKEPPLGDKVLKQLIAHPRVIATPHNATFTPETHHIIAKQICEDMTKNL